MIKGQHEGIFVIEKKVCIQASPFLFSNTSPGLKERLSRKRPQAHTTLEKRRPHREEDTHQCRVVLTLFLPLMPLVPPAALRTPPLNSF